MSEEKDAPRRGPRISCPACGARNSPFGNTPVSDPKICTPAKRVRVGFWPWQHCTAAAEGRSDEKHLHQSCSQCGFKWLCKTVTSLAPSEVKP